MEPAERGRIRNLLCMFAGRSSNWISFHECADLFPPIVLGGGFSLVRLWSTILYGPALYQNGRPGIAGLTTPKKEGGNREHKNIVICQLLRKATVGLTKIISRLLFPEYEGREIVIMVESSFSEFSGNGSTYKKFLRVYRKDCLNRTEIPFASRVLFPQVLNDNSREEQESGMIRRFMLRILATKTVVYCNLGITEDMEKEIKKAERLGRQTEYRYLF